jgi:hypothetical protein
MPLMLSKTYEALKSAQGISDDQAREAAEEIASYEQRLTRIERDLSVLKWMIGANLGLTLIILRQVL